MLVWGYIAVFKAMVHVLESMLFNMEKRFCVIIYELTLKKRNMNSSQTFLCLGQVYISLSGTFHDY